MPTPPQSPKILMLVGAIIAAVLASTMKGIAVGKKEKKEKKEKKQAKRLGLFSARVEPEKAAAAPVVKEQVQPDRNRLLAIEDLPVMVRETPQHVYDAYVMNLAGTLLQGDLLMPGVDKVFESLEVMRRPIYFMSSNSHTAPYDYQRMLAGLGIEAPMENIFTPVRVAVEYLKREFPGATVYSIGDSKFHFHLEHAGIKLSNDPSEVDVVIVAHDRKFSFDKLNIAYQAITGRRRAKLVTTSMVRSWPRAEGGTEPGTRGIVRAIESAAGTRAIRNLGTPERDFIECMFEHMDAPPRRVLLVSDSLTGDIRMAKKYGMPTALVLTGEASLAQAEAAAPKDQPNFVLDTVAGAIPSYIMGQL